MQTARAAGSRTDPRRRRTAEARDHRRRRQGSGHHARHRQEQGETTRGQGDAIRTRIFAQSFGKDPSFAAFYRSMQAYEASLGQGDTTMVLSPDSAFFRYFEKGPTGR
jgi:regulator of protease activity HflC (stomatin/prohibitin superfamily)